ncbi:hypothetical protein ACFCYC_13360 [Streptomyces sp. NPDC056402]|uniref:hypothetical protein n=1 Tax=Streptomyces sp. NPDC056402 TaxID=3345810 RepID=UPI0035D73E36
MDRRCLQLLRGYPRGNEADDDLWSFVPHRELPLRLWRHHLWERPVERVRRPFDRVADRYGRVGRRPGGGPPQRPPSTAAAGYGARVSGTP